MALTPSRSTVFSKGVVLLLGLNGASQDLGLIRAGTIALIGIGTLTGIAKSAKLTGSRDDNVLMGGLGAGSLTGLGGNDALNGGRGNGRLIAARGRIRLSSLRVTARTGSPVSALGSITPRPAACIGFRPSVSCNRDLMRR